MESYIIRQLIDYHCADYGMAYYAVPVGTNNISDHFKFTNQTSLLSILNKRNSGKIITINDVRLYNNDNGVTVSGAFKNILAQATNIEGGYLQTPVRYNSTTASEVYAGIEVRAFGKSTQGNVLKRLGGRSLYPSIVFWHDFRYNGGNKLANGRIYCSCDRGGSTPIILRYGEGISFRSIQNNYSESVFVNITIQDDDSNNGFGVASYSFPTNIIKESDVFSIKNNESGKVIKVLSIEFDYKNPANAMGGGASDSNLSAGIISICKICATDQSGETVTPIKMNSTNTLGDTGVETKRYAKSALLDQSGNTFGPLPAIHRISTLYNGDTSSATRERIQTVSEIKAGRFAPIILNEGEGIGLFSEVIPIGGIHDLIVEYTITEIPAPPSSGGETAYAYP
jgi:hypothetical protein